MCVIVRKGYSYSDLSIGDRIELNDYEKGMIVAFDIKCEETENPIGVCMDSEYCNSGASPNRVDDFDGSIVATLEEHKTSGIYWCDRADILTIEKHKEEVDKHSNEIGVVIIPTKEYFVKESIGKMKADRKEQLVSIMKNFLDRSEELRPKHIEEYSSIINNEWLIIKEGE